MSAVPTAFQRSPLSRNTQMIEQTLRIFILEKDKKQAARLKAAIQKQAPRAIFTLARDEQEFLDKLSWGRHDLIIKHHRQNCYYLPDVSQIIRRIASETPLLLLTDSEQPKVKPRRMISLEMISFISYTELTNDRSSLLNQTLRKALQLKELKNEAFQMDLSKERMVQKALFLLNQAADFENKSLVMELLQSALKS